MKTRVSIIIRSYNEEKHMKKLLESITAQNTSFGYEIILVDSGSTDQTLSIAGRFPVKIVEIKPEDFSFGYSLNQGIRASSGDFLVMISAHCYPQQQDWLEQMTKPFANPKVALVYGKQRGNSTTKYSEHQIFRTWFPNGSNPCQQHPFCNNANSAIRRSLWQHQNYDESLTGLEDLAWAKVMVEQGRCIYYNADAAIVHVHDESFRQIYNRYKREAISYYHIFEKERFLFVDFIKLFLLNLVADSKYALKNRVFIKYFAEIVRFRFNQFFATHRGYKYKKDVTSELRSIFYYPNKTRSTLNK